MIGRTTVHATDNSVVVQGGYATEQRSWGDMEISFRARAPLNAEQVQIWAGFRQRDRDSRYVFALRGGNNNDIYFARYAPDGGAKFLGFAPLDFTPAPGVWYRLRVVTLGNRFQIYLNDEKLPRLNVEDGGALWKEGSVLLGGGWVPTEFSDLQVRALSDQDKRTSLALGEKSWVPPAANKEALRKAQRTKYSAAKVATLSPLRTEVSLDGDWLFMPDYQLLSGQPPVRLSYSDRNWHVMQVPLFWTPGLSWLYGETSFPELSGVSTTKGAAESLFVQQVSRCDGYTFDWRRTKSAWYRHYLELPADLGGRRFELTFDAIAKVSEVWVNGTKIGTHTGMFGQVKCDATKAIRPGRNVIAVHVIAETGSDDQSASQIASVAVTMDVTSAMLYSVPHGTLQGDVGGIWQSVRLIATAPVLVSDAFVEPGLHMADISLEILNSGKQPVTLTVTYAISSVRDGKLLYSGEVPQPFTAAGGEIGHLKLTTPHLDPEPWSPWEPNLYMLEIQLKRGGEIIDEYKTRFGFRTFTLDGGRFLLNGEPFWLRGANPFPNALRPNDVALARQFIGLAHAGNVRVTRSHIVPFTPAWLDAADEIGLAVSFEGTWPWLMLQGEPPERDLLGVWHDEFLSLVRQYRNHPSLILWTVNNEMKFQELDQNNPPLLQKKWPILDEMIRSIRQLDPTRPIVADSSYVRKIAQKGYDSLVKPQDYDDGDVDDLHRYFGWYNESFFHLYNGEFNRFDTPNRPFVSQELSTGYPNNDDGHPVRSYLFDHHTPQTLVGDDAYENADPAIFLKRHAFMTKELTETVRRTSHNVSAGVLPFAYVTWFQSPWLVNGIKPWPAYYAVKTAMQPILTSAELYGRHFYSHRTVQRRVCIVNDAEDRKAIPGSHLIWQFVGDGKVLSQGQAEVPSVNYYENHWLDVDFKSPENLAAPRVDGQLVLRLEANGAVLSENSYDVVLTTAEWAKGDLRGMPSLAFWNPGKKPAPSLTARAIDSISAAKTEEILVIGNLNGITLAPTDIDQLKAFLAQGGRVLMLRPGNSLPVLFPEQIKTYKAKEGEITTMRVPESPVFSGIEPLDLAWFETGGKRVPIACSGVFQLDITRSDTTAFVWQCDIHGYLKNKSALAAMSGTPLVEIRVGKGRVIASEMNFEAEKVDPIARRLLSNVINYLNTEPAFSTQSLP